MLICFTSDLHGDRRLYSQLEEARCEVECKRLELEESRMRLEESSVRVEQLQRYEQESAYWRARYGKLEAFLSRRPRLTAAIRWCRKVVSHVL